jgi:chromosome segregation ATPase
VELQQRQQQLDDQQQELQHEYALVNQSALEQDLSALQALATAHSTLQHLQQQHEGAATALEQLLDERYSRLLTVLHSLNAQLDTVYSRLTGGCGKAYCSYTAERRLLFSQGVTLHVQPDGSTWRRLGMLSGGQRSLATLALSFALQVRWWCRCWCKRMLYRKCTQVL